MEPLDLETREPARLSTVTALCVATLVGAQLVAVLLVPVNHDIGWCLDVAHRILSGGERLYSTIIEINPPLIMWYALVAAWLADLIGAPPPLAYHVLTALIVLACIGLTAFLLHRLLYGRRPGLRALLIVLFAFFAGPFTGYEFGQREHLLFVTLVPYLVGAVVTIRQRSASRAPLVVTGLLAAFGLAMKPFFLPIWVATELVVARRRGMAALLRPQALAMAAVFAAYGVAVVLFALDYLTVARWGMSTYSSFYPTPFARILLSWQSAVALIAVLAVLAAPRIPEIAPFGRLGAATIALLTAAVYIQLKGWAYHWYPVLAFSGLMGALALYAVLDRLSQRAILPASVRARSALVYGATLLLLGAGLHRSNDTVYRWAALNETPWYLQDMIEAVGRYPDARTVMSLTSTMQATFPLVNVTGLEYASRFAALWMLPGAYRQPDPGGATGYHARPAMQDVEAFAFDAVLEDAERRPDLLIVDRVPPGRQLAGFDYLAYYGQSARFREVLAEYTEVALIGGRYRLFAHTKTVGM